jgi:transposase InsO family protein
MNVHKNARLTPRGREQMVQQIVAHGHSVKRVAEAFGLSRRTVAKWRARFEREGVGGLIDRSSRPVRLPRARAVSKARRIEQLRRQRLPYAQIAARVGLSAASVCRWLRARGLHRLARLEPPVPVVRYEKDRPGELVHIDIKKLARIARVGHRITGQRTDRVRGVGYEHVFVAVDDRSRVACAQILPDEQQGSALIFLNTVCAFYQRLGVRIERVMTDNGPAFLSRAFEGACSRLNIKHVRTRPYTPRTNGKAERFIQTMLREWAYARAFKHSDIRLAHLLKWLHYYNWHRPHSSLNGQPPLAAIGLPVNNLLQLHT